VASLHSRDDDELRSRLGGLSLETCPLCGKPSPGGKPHEYHFPKPSTGPKTSTPPMPAPPGSSAARSHAKAWLVGLTALVVLVVAVGLIVKVSQRGGSCQVASSSFVTQLGVPTYAKADYYRYKTFARASDGAQASVFIIAIRSGSMTGVWAVDEDPATSPPNGWVGIPSPGTDALALVPDLGDGVNYGAGYFPGVPYSEALAAAQDSSAIGKVEGCLSSA
jgi:hypothetical protein